MQKQTFTKILILVFFTLMSFNLTSAQQPKTVTDYLLALPANFYEFIEPGYNKYQKNKPKTQAQIEEYRRSRIVIEDIKNGYIKYKEDPNMDDWAEIALFKRNNGEYLM